MKSQIALLERLVETTVGNKCCNGRILEFRFSLHLMSLYGELGMKRVSLLRFVDGVVMEELVPQFLFRDF